MPSIQWINYSETKSWSFSENVGLFSNTQIGHWPVVRLGDLITRSKHPLIVEDEIVYRRITIRNNAGGVQLRMRQGVVEELYGREIKTKRQFMASSGQLVISKIDVRNGAVGIVPKEADGAIVTGNFWTYDITDSRIVPEILPLLLTRPSVLNKIDQMSHGTTNRKYITEDQILSISIDLPDVHTQKKLLSDYSSLRKRMSEKELRIQKTTQEMRDVLGAVISSSYHNETPSDTMKTVLFSQMTNWSYFELSDVRIKSNYHMARLGDCLDCIMEHPDGSVYLAPSKFPSTLFSFIGMEDVEKFTGLLQGQIRPVLGSQLKTSSLRLGKDFIIFGKLRPNLGKYWLNEVNDDNLICSSEFFVFKSGRAVTKEYLLSFLGSDFLQEQMKGKTSGARMPRVSLDVFLNFLIPLPPNDIQVQIGKESRQKRKTIMRLKRELGSLKVEKNQLFVSSYLY